MKKLNTKGFGAVEILLIVVLVSLIAGVGYYVYSSQKKTNSTLDNAAKSEGEPQKTEKKAQATQPAKTAEDTAKYLTIKEWGVKIPLSDVTKTATYRMENGVGYLIVNITNDPNSSSCNDQAHITKVTSPNENSDNWRDKPSELQKSGSNVGGTYYFIEGSQSACTDNAKIQEQATAIRTAWVNQSKLITAQ